MTVDAEFPAELRAQIDGLGAELDHVNLRAEVAAVAELVAADLESWPRKDTVQDHFQHEVGIAVRRGLSEDEARAAVSAGFREVWGEEWTP